MKNPTSEVAPQISNERAEELTIAVAEAVGKGIRLGAAAMVAAAMAAVRLSRGGPGPR